MENVNIVKLEPIMMGKAMAVTLADGRSCTAWADKINPASLVLGNAQLEIKPYTSKTGKTGFNVAAVGERQIEINPSLYGIKPVAQEQTATVTNRPLKDDSIVAQTFIIRAVELVNNDKVEGETLAMKLYNAIKELHPAYLFAVDLLEQRDGNL